MNNVIIVENGEPMTTSLEVAKYFDKEHRDVLRAIDNIIEKGLRNITQTLKDKAMAYFELSEYVNEQNHQTYRMYKMNQKGFSLLAGGFTDKKFMEYKVMFVEQFDDMQKQLEQQAQQQFFIPETVEQQYKREQLAIRKQESENAKSREGRALLKLTKNDPALVKQIVPQLFAGLLGADTVKQIELTEPQYIYSASAIGKKLGLEPYTVGSLAQELGLKATREEGANQFTKNTEVPLGDGTVKSTWRYSEEAYQAMKEALEA